jgi:hypothetical protein
MEKIWLIRSVKRKLLFSYVSYSVSILYSNPFSIVPLIHGLVLTIRITEAL